MEEVIIHEYKEMSIPMGMFSDSDLKYLKHISKNQSNFTIELEENYEKEIRYKIKNEASAGVIELSKVRLYFGSKVNADLIYMLHYLRNENCFFIDLEKPIYLEEGDAFFDFIARLFLKELDDIFKKGLNRRYIHQEEKQLYVRGSIDFSKQWRNQFEANVAFYCKWDELTFDSIENRLILQAIKLLIPLIRNDEETRLYLQKHMVTFLDFGVSFTELGPQDCERVVYHRMNESYSKIIPLVKIILERSFIRSESSGKSKGFNFLVNMNKLFEDLVTEVVTRVINQKHSKYNVIKQETIKSLVKDDLIEIRPDILLKNNENGDFEFVIDAKYKYKADSSNYFQLIAYSLAIPTTKRGLMIFPESEKELIECVTVQNLYQKDSSEVMIHCKALPLCCKEKKSFKDFKNNLEEAMGDILKRILNNEQIEMNENE